MFCKHEWSMLTETVTKSKYESSINAIQGSKTTNIKLPWQMCCAERKHIQTFTCSKCGELKRYVDNI